MVLAWRLTPYIMGTLKLYRASAGSGKTFRLARDYVFLLLKNPDLFRNILAVTFTNKAADEMKGRILKKLFEMSSSENETDYTDYFVNEKGLSRVEVKERSGRILKSILHQYSYFSVQTIDSFFQKVIRGFIRELGLPYNYTIELNHDRVLDMAVDTLIREADENPELRSWLVQYANMKILEGNSWNFRRNLVQMGKEYFTEKVKALGDEMMNSIQSRGFLKSYRDELRKLIQDFESEMQEFGKRALLIMDENSLEVDDFVQKRNGVGAYFTRIADKQKFAYNSYVKAAAGDIEKWFPAKSEFALKQLALVRNVLQPLLLETIEFFHQSHPSYASAKIVLNQFYSLGVFYDLVERIKNYSKDTNSFLISEASSFLWKIIDSNDTPFIYEKTGSFFKHFLLDEFQDTSVIQWANFKPLIENSLAQGYENIVVGDVKQSIYRWRNSDWKIMAEKLDSDFSGYEPREESLRSNFRSRENIVAFNNALFLSAPEILQDIYNADLDDSVLENRESAEMQTKILNIYKEPAQKISRPTGSKGGFVQLNFYDQKDWKAKSGEEFPVEVGKLLKMGVKPGQIAILVRDKKDSRRAVEALMSFQENHRESGFANFALISNDTLFLQSSPVVRFLLNFLKYLVNPEDKINLAELYFEFQTLNTRLRDQSCFITDLAYGISFLITNSSIEEEVEKLKILSLPEMTEGIVRLFEIGKTGRDLPYIYAFMDIVLDFSREAPGDISTFLNWWEEEGHSKSLKLGDDSNALRVLTVHKSKGLQFSYLFIPYAGWYIDHTKVYPVLWCKPSVAPFQKIPLLPVKYSPSLKESIFAADYYREKLDAFIDNINLIYVALTRAEDGLWLYGPEDTQVKTIAGLIKKSMLKADVKSSFEDFPLVQFDKHWNEAKTQWTIGKIDECEKTDILSEAYISLNAYHSWPGIPRLRLKYQGEEFFSDDHREKVNRGKILHQIFEYIKTREDIVSALEIVRRTGMIDASGLKEYQLIIEEMTAHSRVRDWFDGSREVKAEAEILLGSGELRRPDRVMIENGKAVVVDYKFGKLKKESYRKQVMYYKKCLIEMGYKEVEGYLWYAVLGEVDKVE